MNCICDDFKFPPDLAIRAGLTHLPRQLGTFAEFRRALLRAASIRTTALLENHPLWSLRYLTERDRDGLKKELTAFGEWRGRHPEDFGMMLIEMWAYVCDLTSFYDSVFANDSYVGTSVRRDSIRKLVDPLGYLPRPAVAALAELAVFADGKRAVSLPVGTAFSSGAFDGHPPQIFELGQQTTIHPLLNEWTVLPIRRSVFSTFGVLNSTFLCELGSVNVKEGDLVMVKVGSSRYAVHVSSIEPHEGADHLSYTAVTVDSLIWIPGGTPVTSIQLLKPTVKSTLWNQTSPAFGPLYADETAAAPYATWFLLDSITPGIRVGQDLIVEKGTSLYAGDIHATRRAAIILQSSSTTNILDKDDKIIAKVPVPTVYAYTTQVDFEPHVPGINLPATSIDASTEFTIHRTFVTAGKITIESLTEVDRTDPLNVKTPVERPRDASLPGKFQLEDFNGLGLTRPGSLNFTTGHFTVQGDPWPNTLATPVNLFGNIVSTSRGETVKPEILGVGDSSIANQSFTLKKSPLTYLPSPSESTSSGLTSTLKVYVDGLQWTEAPSFYGHKGDEEIYIVRQNDKNESTVTFGDGVLGKRLNTGAVAVAYYRFGGGGAMPPAGSITQIAKAVKGLKSVRSPVAPYGGADEEAASSLQKFAPRSALLLGRAVSLPDLEAAAASYAGVRAVSAEWRWSHVLQLPAAHIWYLADGDLTELILNKLRSLTQPDTPIQVERALPTLTRLSIQIAWDPKRFEADVLAAVRTALTNVEEGILAPEILGIGKTLFRSQIFEAILSVEGVTSVTGLSYWYSPFNNFGVKVPAGHYFDFSNQLFLNGRNA
ncbi:MAG TPA: hypothetical protein VI306_18700 [Pyrinomonadaceae bacterium]